jgi:predicted pyridoxine 5'-phosphate oxidase superfamily flavin-nucleotide-binding protein
MSSRPVPGLSGEETIDRMEETMSQPTARVHTQFSQPGATARPWAEVVEVLSGSEMFWLSTVRRDGRPHVTPLPAVWLDGAMHFCTGPGEQKAKNLEANPRCALTTGTNEYRSGLDVVVEGVAVRVTDEVLLRRLGDLWLTKLGWPFEIVDGAFGDGQGRVAYVFRVAPEKVLAFGKGSPYSQTRYRFPD